MPEATSGLSNIKPISVGLIPESIIVRVLDTNAAPAVSDKQHIV